jgi:hypothetical protein
LREKKLTPDVILAAILGVALCHHLDPQKGNKEYRRVQIGKLLNRMGGDTTRRWDSHTSRPGSPSTIVMRWFPASEGLVLRELGKSADASIEFLPDRLDEIASFAAQGRSKQAMKSLPFADA